MSFCRTQKLTAEVQPTGYSRLFIPLETNRTVESVGGIILRTSLLDPSVRLSPHSAPDNLSF
ncbi:MAG: hypothetical protein ACKO7A_15825, partial [Microcystis sp.]